MYHYPGRKKPELYTYSLLGMQKSGYKLHIENLYTSSGNTTTSATPIQRPWTLPRALGRSRPNETVSEGWSSPELCSISTLFRWWHSRPDLWAKSKKRVEITAVVEPPRSSWFRGFSRRPLNRPDRPNFEGCGPCAPICGPSHQKKTSGNYRRRQTGQICLISKIICRRRYCSDRAY